MIIDSTYRFYQGNMGAAGLCYLAQGLFDASFDLTGNENVWDLAAGQIIAEEAGARVSVIQDKDTNTKHMLITNGKIHSVLLKLLR